MRRKKGRGMRTMARLTDLPNIGPKLAENLEKAGIETPERLRELGAEEAFLRIRTQADAASCLHQLRLWRERRRASISACCPRSGRQS